VRSNAQGYTYELFDGVGAFSTHADFHNDNFTKLAISTGPRSLECPLSKGPWLRCYAIASRSTMAEPKAET